MKKIILATSFLLGSIFAQAQHLELGVHGGYGATWLLNSNVFDQGSNLDPASSFGAQYGLHAAYVLPSRLGIIMDLDLAKVNQKYKGTSGVTSFDASDKLSYFEIPILLRKYSKNGFFFELGPKFSFLTSAKESITSSPVSLNDRSNVNVKEGYGKMIVSAALGIGGHFALGKNWYADAGLRLAYGFNDATVKFSAADLNTKTLSEGTTYAHLDQNLLYSYKSTNLATGHVILGLSYQIPMNKKSKSNSKK